MNAYQFPISVFQTSLFKFKVSDANTINCLMPVVTRWLNHPGAKRVLWINGSTASQDVKLELLLRYHDAELSNP